MIYSNTLTKKEAVQLAKKSSKKFQNKTIYNSMRDILHPPGVTRFHDVFHFNSLRGILK